MKRATVLLKKEPADLACDSTIEVLERAKRGDHWTVSRALIRLGSEMKTKGKT